MSNSTSEYGLHISWPRLLLLGYVHFAIYIGLRMAFERVILHYVLCSVWLVTIMSSL